MNGPGEYLLYTQMLQLLPEQDIENNKGDAGKDEIPLPDMYHRFYPCIGVKQEHVGVG